MSLYSAVLGFDILCRQNNVFVNTRYGVVFIGMHIDDLTKQLRKYCLNPIRDKENPRKFDFIGDLNDVCISVTCQHGVIHRIWYEGIVSLIPSCFIYKVGKKRFFTGTRVDGWMIGIKGNDELFMKEDNSVQANDVSSQSLGITNEVLNRGKGFEGSRSAELTKLRQEYDVIGKKKRDLRARMVDLQKKCDSKMNITREHQKKLKEYQSEFGKIWDNYDKAVKELSTDISRLEKVGKLVEDDDNSLFVELAEGVDNMAKRGDKDSIMAMKIITYLKPFRDSCESQLSQIELMTKKCRKLKHEADVYAKSTEYQALRSEYKKCWDESNSIGVRMMQIETIFKKSGVSM